MAIDLSNIPYIQVSWTSLKTLVSSKQLQLQYDTTDSATYFIFAIDGTTVGYSCTIYKTLPIGVIGIDGYQNSLDLTDFETNYKPSANSAILCAIGVAKWFGSTAPTVGQKPMASSLPVTMASDQAAIPVSVSGTINGTTCANIVRFLEFPITTHVETSINLTYTVTSGKSFYLCFFGGIASSPQPAVFRLKVAGTTVLVRLSSGHGSDGDFSPTAPVLIATSGQQITFTIDPQNPNGTGWVSLMGFEA